MTIQAIVFDFDGTMLDTETPIYKSWQAIYEKYDQHLPQEVWADVIGSTQLSFDPFQKLQSAVATPLNRAALEAERRDIEWRLIETQPLQPGVMPLIEEALQQNIPLAIASNSHISWVAKHLARLNMLDYFDTIVTRDQVERYKPDPLMYEESARRMGVAPSKAVAIEDSPIGAASAVEAGMLTIVVPVEMTGHLTFPQGVHRLDSLAGITIDDIAKFIA